MGTVKKSRRALAQAHTESMPTVTSNDQDFIDRMRKKLGIRDYYRLVVIMIVMVDQMAVDVKNRSCPKK